MIKYKLQVGGAQINAIQYKGEPIGHLHYKGTQYSYWENPPPAPEPPPPAPPLPPLAVYRLTGDSVGMTRLTLNVAGTNRVDLQVGIKASGYNYFAYQRRLLRGEWTDEQKGNTAGMRTGEVMVYGYKGELVPETVTSVSSPPSQLMGMRISWIGSRVSPSLSFTLYHNIQGAFGLGNRLSYGATATFNESGACVSAQDTSYASTPNGNDKTDALRPTLTRSGSSFRVRDGAWVRLVKVSG